MEFNIPPLEISIPPTTAIWIIWLFKRHAKPVCLFYYWNIVRESEHLSLRHLYFGQTSKDNIWQKFSQILKLIIKGRKVKVWVGEQAQWHGMILHDLTWLRESIVGHLLNEIMTSYSKCYIWMRKNLLCALKVPFVFHFLQDVWTWINTACIYGSLNTPLYIQWRLSPQNTLDDVWLLKGRERYSKQITAQVKMSDSLVAKGRKQSILSVCVFSCLCVAVCIF